MKRMLVSAIAIGLVFTAVQPADAQRSRNRSAARMVTLPANSDVLVRLDEDVTSKRTKVGDTFRASVATAVMQGGVTVIPRGAAVTGRIAYRTGKGAFGKSAKMEIEFVSVSVNGQQHQLVGKFRQEGEGNTGATVGTAIVAGPFAALVTGRSATFARDREFRAATREPISVRY